MKSCLFVLVVSVGAYSSAGAQSGPATDRLLAEYQRQGATEMDAGSGQRFWVRRFPRKNSIKPRSCASCHTADPRVGGRHVTTGKAIAPLAPATNPKRFTNIGKIRKWFKRNCKWTLGRECTAQEKGNVLLYLADL